MQIAYLANLRLPSERANSIQTVHMAAALAQAGHQVTLYYPRRDVGDDFSSVDIFEYYQLKARFTLRPVFCIDLFPWVQRSRWRLQLERLTFAILVISFGLGLLWALRHDAPDVYYSRDMFAALALAIGYPSHCRRLFFEAHTFPVSAASHRLYRWLTGRIAGLVTITAGLRDEFLVLGVPAEATHIAPDGVSPERFGQLNRAEARARLGISPDLTLILYTGNLFAWKGVYTLVEAAPALNDLAEVWLIGGASHNVQAVQAKASRIGASNVKLLGYRPPAEIPTWLAAADVLVLPNSGTSAISARHTSPLKLFEYLAAARPIVASALPSLSEILTDGENALLVSPDDPAALAAGLRRVVTDRNLASQLTAHSAETAATYSWQQRAIDLGEFITRRLQ